MPTARYALTAALLAAALPAQSDAERDALVAVEEIWGRAPHSAFVDLVEHRGALWCAFREGSRHVPGTNGVTRILRGSPDGQTWHSVARLDQQGVDLRDPKLSVMPDGRLLVTIGGSVYQGERLQGYGPWRSLGTVSEDGSTASFTAPEPVTLQGDLNSGRDWLWRVTWHEGVAWGVVYQTVDAGSRLRLARSDDARSWQHVHSPSLEPAVRPNETTLRFLPSGEMLALVRCEGRDQALLGRAAPPYTEFNWSKIEHRIGGPDLLALPRPAAEPVLLAAGRAYDVGGARTAIWRLRSDGTTQRLVTLPSSGDTSYPRLLKTRDGERLLCAYYSSHQGGRTAIHLATLRLAEVLAIE